MAETLLLLPALLLLSLGIGELLSGDKSGTQHFLELIPFVAFGYLCWRSSKIGGVLLTSTAIILSILYFLLFTNSPLTVRIINDLLLFFPLLVAGMLFFSSNDSKDW
jgi:hypothetical protein